MRSLRKTGEIIGTTIGAFISQPFTTLHIIVLLNIFKFPTMPHIIYFVLNRTLKRIAKESMNVPFNALTIRNLSFSHSLVIALCLFPLISWQETRQDRTFPSFPFVVLLSPLVPLPLLLPPAVRSCSGWSWDEDDSVEEVGGRVGLRGRDLRGHGAAAAGRHQAG
jgi:hypothetical protein